MFMTGVLCTVCGAQVYFFNFNQINMKNCFSIFRSSSLNLNWMHISLYISITKCVLFLFAGSLEL